MLRVDGVRSVVGEIRRERFRFLLMRLFFAGLLFLSVTLTAWAVPAVPLGMTAADYSAATLVLLVFTVACSVASVLFTLIWAPQFRGEPLPEFLRVLFGASQLIRGPRQFKSRLVAECRRASKDRRHVFSLIVVQLPEGGVADAQPSLLTEIESMRRYVAMAVRNAIRAEDIVGEFWSREVWVLSIGAPPEARESIADRLAQGLARAEDSGLFQGCRLGGSTFGADGEEPNELFSAAKERLTLLSELATHVGPAEGDLESAA